MDGVDLNKYGNDDPATAEAYDAVEGSSRCLNPDCRSTNLVSDWAAGDVVCSECGWVRHERVEDPSSDLYARDDTQTTRVTVNSQLTNMLEDDRLIIDAKAGSKMGNVVKAQGGRSKRDKLLLDVREDVRRLSARLPGELYEDVQLKAVDLFMKLWESTGCRLRKSPQVVAACLWMVCYLLHQPFVDSDFHKALVGECTDPKKHFKQAKKLLQEHVSSNQELEKFARQTGEGSGNDATQYSALCQRWCSQLGLPFAIGVLATAIGEQLRSHHSSNIERRETVYSVALHLACHRPQATAKEEQITLQRITAVSGAKHNKVVGLSEKVYTKRSVFLEEAVKKLEEGTKRALGL